MILRTKTVLKMKSKDSAALLDLDFGKGKKVSNLIVHLIKYFLSEDDINDIKKELKNH